MWVYQKPESSEPLEPLSAPSVPDSTLLKTNVTLPEPNDPFPAEGPSQAVPAVPEPLETPRKRSLRADHSCILLADFLCSGNGGSGNGPFPDGTSDRLRGADRFASAGSVRNWFSAHFLFPDPLWGRGRDAVLSAADQPELEGTVGLFRRIRASDRACRRLSVSVRRAGAAGQ